MPLSFHELVGERTDGMTLVKRGVLVGDGAALSIADLQQRESKQAVKESTKVG